MKEERIMVAIKNPGEQPYVTVVRNKLEDLQKIVGGYIETVLTVIRESVRLQGVILIGNEEGALGELPLNRVGQLLYYGTVFAVGVQGEEFCSLPGVMVAPLLLRIMEEPEDEDE